MLPRLLGRGPGPLDDRDVEALSSAGGEEIQRVLEMTEIEHTYGRTPALKGVSLMVDAGEVVAVTGPSGCGKSTLLHAGAGIVRPQRGSVRLLGQDLSELHEAERTRLRRGHVGIVLQFGQLVPDVPVIDNVALPLLFEGRGRARAHAAAADWLERVGMGLSRDKLPAELSGGEGQRVAVARALVTEPRIVFADEPTGSMDTIGGEQLLDLLLGAAREGSAAVVLVTHDNVVAARADREVRMRDGLVESETVLQ
jgi:putative ABC transport system ATP-binding protein